MGKYEHAEKPSHVDYGFAADFQSNLYESAGVRIFACGEKVDQVVYRSLPGTGTLAFDGAELPNAEANDDETAWCADGAGSPGERNPNCASE